MDMNVGSTRGEDGGSVRRATLAGNQLRSRRHAKSQTPAGGARSRPQPDFIGIWLALTLFICAIQHINTPPHEEFVVSRLFVTFPASRWPITWVDSRQDQPSSNFVWPIWQLSPYYRPCRKFSWVQLEFRSCRHSYCLTLMLILQAGDVDLNPGQRRPKFPCDLCQKAAKWGQNCLQCKLCHNCFHTICLGMPDSLYQTHVDYESLTWICSGCGMPQFWNLSSVLFGSTLTTDPPVTPYTDMTSSVSDLASPVTSTSSPSGQLPSATSMPIAPQTRATEPPPSLVDGRRKPETHRAHRKDELLLLVANCNGVTGKKASLEHMLGSMNPDIFIGAEWKIDASIHDAEFLPANYFISR